MNLFKLLQRDHQRIMNLIEKLKQTTTKAIRTRNAYFLRLQEEIEVHTELEEGVLYAQLKPFKEAKELIKLAEKEHKGVKKNLEELRKIPRASKEWKPALKFLKKSLDGHIESEESKIFSIAMQVLSAEQLEDMLTRFEEEKKDRAEGMMG